MLPKNSLDIYMGDLVRLEGDLQMQAGMGIVINVKTDTEDLLDIIEWAEYLNGRKFPKEDELFLHKPMALVLWTRDKLSKLHRTPKPIWINFTELAIVQKVERDTDDSCTIRSTKHSR